VAKALAYTSAPAPGQASMLAGSSLTPKNVPIAGSEAAVLIEKCSEVNDAVGTCALPVKRDNADGTTSLFARLDLTATSDPSGPATCDKAMPAVDAMGGELVTLTSSADITALTPFVRDAAGKPVWVAPVDPASAVAKALAYTSAPAPGQMAALQLTAQNTVALVNVACGTEGVALMQSDVAGGASAPASTLCSKQEEITPSGQDTCAYTVASETQPVTAAAAQAVSLALGKRVVSFASQAEFDAVRASLADSYAAALLASGALAGLWVDAAGSAYLPPGYSLPASGQASLLAGAALELSNAPAASTVAAILLEKCSEVDTSFGE